MRNKLSMIQRSCNDTGICVIKPKLSAVIKTSKVNIVKPDNVNAECPPKIKEVAMRIMKYIFTNG